MRIVAFLMMSVLLVACSDSDSPQPQQPNTNTNATVSSPKAETKKSGLYDFDTWAGESVSLVSASNVNDVFGIVRLAPKKKAEMLDYEGNTATRYFLRDDNVNEFFNVVNSVNFLEINWIKAEDTDMLAAKKLGVENTQKAYHAARSMLGDKGGELIKSMVTKTNFNAPEIVNGKTIAQARCEYFLCTLIIKK